MTNRLTRLLNQGNRGENPKASLREFFCFIGYLAGVAIILMWPIAVWPTEKAVQSNSPDIVHSATKTLSATRAQSPEKLEKLFIKGRIQMRMMSGGRDTFWSTGTQDFNMVDFNFRRLRLGAVYQLDKNWGMQVDLRLENALNRPYITTQKGNCGGAPCVTAVALKESRGLLQEANLSYEQGTAGFKFSFGLIRLPFNREFFTSSSNLIALERAMATSAMHQWDTGLRFDYYPLSIFAAEKYKYHLGIYGSVTTGHGGGGDDGFGRRYDMQQTQGSASATVSPLWSLRIEYNVFGGLDKKGKAKGWVEGNEIFQRDLKLSIGAGLTGTNERKLGTHISTEFTPVSSAISLSTGSGSGKCISPMAGQTCSLLAQTYDMTLAYRGIYFNASYQFYGGLSGNNVTGYTFTTGYSIPLYAEATLMPLLRYDFMKGNLAAPNSSGLASDPANQFQVAWAGLNLFHSEHNLKFQLFYNIMANNYKGYDAAKNPLGGYAQNLIIFQAQLNFKTGVGI